MNKWNRRDVLKGGIASFGAGVLLPSIVTATADPVSITNQKSHVSAEITSNAIRERLLLDFGWRFTLGHASDPAKDFNYNQGKVLSRAGTFATPALPGFDDSQWRAVDIPHDWVVELPFEN